MTDENRLLLVNQYRLLALQDPANKEQYEKEIRILKNGHVIDYDSLFAELSTEIPVEITREVDEIINMYRAIRNAKSTLTPEQEKEQQDLLNRIRFKGFDGSHDSHYYYFKAIMEDPDFYTDLDGWPINSHFQGDLPRYRSMLKVHKELMDEKKYNWGLNELQRLGAAI